MLSKIFNFSYELCLTLCLILIFIFTKWYQTRKCKSWKLVPYISMIKTNMIHSVHILQPFFAFFLMFLIWEDKFFQLRGMLGNMLFFWKSELGYAYKRYDYKKKVYSLADNCRKTRSLFANFRKFHHPFTSNKISIPLSNFNKNADHSAY